MISGRASPIASLLVACLGVSCGGATAGGGVAANGQPPIVVNVYPEWDMDTTARALSEAAAISGLRGACGLLWGTVTPAPSFRLTVVELPTEKVVGWLGCEADLDRAWAPCGTTETVCNPKTRDGGLVALRNGVLIGSHASESNEIVEIHPETIPQDGHNYVFVIAGQPKAPAVPLLSKLRAAGPGAIVLLPLDVEPEPAE